MFSLIQNKLNTFPKHYLQIGKNVGILLGLNGLQRLFGLATTYFLVRALSQESYGEYNFILSSIGLLSLFALPYKVDILVQWTSHLSYNTKHKHRTKPGTSRSITL